MLKEELVALNVPPVIKLPPASRSPVLKLRWPNTPPDFQPIPVTSELVREKVVLVPLPLAPGMPSVLATQVSNELDWQLSALAATGASKRTTPANRAHCATTRSGKNDRSAMDKTLLIAHFQSRGQSCNPPNEVFDVEKTFSEMLSGKNPGFYRRLCRRA
jgi:hypothetical protein